MYLRRQYTDARNVRTDRTELFVRNHKLAEEYKEQQYIQNLEMNL